VRTLARWTRRHRLLSLLGLGLVAAGVAWLRAWGGSPAPAPVEPAAAASRAPGTGLDTPAMGTPTREVAAELARDADTESPDGVGVVPGSYRGSVKPRADGSAPSPEYTIKGKEGSMLCHDPSSPYYNRTKADVWFCSEQEASAAGFRVWSRRR
jgi:hypothetical protein